MKSKATRASVWTRPGDWPLAVKVVVLCVGLSAALAAVLTLMGYRQTSEGVQVQAEAALTSDAQMGVSAIDDWNARRLADMQLLSGLASVRRYLEAVAADKTPPAEDVAAVKDILVRVPTLAKEVDSVALVPPKGAIAFDTIATNVGTNMGQRDYFQEGMKGKTFITGVSVPLTRPEPAIFHSAPVKGSNGEPLGIVRSRASLTEATKAVEAAKDRVGKGAVGVVLDQDGLVMASSVDPQWLLRPVVPLTKDKSDAMLKDKRWGNNAAPEALGLTDLAQAVGIHERKSFNWKLGGIDYRAVALPLAQTQWTYVAALPVATFQSAANDFLRNAAITAILAMLLAFALAVLFARPMAQAANRVTRWARLLAAGDLGFEVQVRSQDELGQVAMAFQEVVNAQREFADAARAVAEGNLTRSVTPRSEADVLGMAFTSMVANLREMVVSVSHSARKLADASSGLSAASSQAGAASRQIAGTIQEVARGNQDVYGSVQDASSSVDQLARAIDQIAQGAQEQARSMEKTSNSVMRLNEAVARTSSASERLSQAGREVQQSAENGAKAVEMSMAGIASAKARTRAAQNEVLDLNKYSEEIGAIVEAIDDIADQTNLLALNAAIEAARAGEHGRGFAVVADEVRQLAERSGRSTKEIAGLIKDLRREIQEAVDAIELGVKEVESGAGVTEQAGVALREILASVQMTTEQVTQIARSVDEMQTVSQEVANLMDSVSAVVEQSTAATQEMAASSHDVTGSVEKVAAVSEETSAATEEVSASTEEMSGQMEEMVGQVESLAQMAFELQAVVARFQTGENTAEETEVVMRRRKGDWTEAQRRPHAAAPTSAAIVGEPHHSHQSLRR